MAGREGGHSISPKTPTPHNQQMEEKEKIMEHKKKEQIRPIKKHRLCS